MGDIHRVSDDRRDQYRRRARSVSAARFGRQARVDRRPDICPDVVDQRSSPRPQRNKYSDPRGRPSARCKGCHRRHSRDLSSGCADHGGRRNRLPQPGRRAGRRGDAGDDSGGRRRTELFGHGAARPKPAQAPQRLRICWADRPACPRPAPVGPPGAARGRNPGNLVVPAAAEQQGSNTAMRQLPVLVGVFAYLSLLTIGGGMSAFPEMKTLTVDVYHWLTFPQLIHFFSVGQLAPGPNMMMVAAVGEWIAGPLGALLVVTAFFLPTALITFCVGRLWNRLEGWPWRDVIQRGLAPVAIGLLLSGSLTVAKGAVTGWLTAFIALAVFGLLLRTRINPAILIFGSGLIGLFTYLDRL